MAQQLLSIASEALQTTSRDGSGKGTARFTRGDTHMALRNCSENHCSKADAELNDVCKQEGWAIGHPVVTRDDKGPCQCHCSCLALGTPVAASPENYRPIQDFQVGDKVLAAGGDLKWKEVEVKFSNGTTGGSVQPYTVFLQYGEKSLIVTADHLFFMADGKLKRADRISIQDKLVRPDGTQVSLTAVSLGTFYGGFHHIATSDTDPKGKLDGHLLNTNGVVSADYALQLFQPAEVAGAHLLAAGHEDLPVLGSPEYAERYGEPKEPEEGAASSSRWFAVGSEPPAKKTDNVFVPMSKARVKIPADALSFISETQAKALAKDPKRPLTATDAQAWAEYLVTQYQAFYPDVIYEIDWYNNDVNAFAWRADGVGHVALLGGLIRFPAIEVEGLALVTAHELSHLYGGPPYYSGTTLSCEGQADFYGARNVMRKVWFGESYFTTMVAAIAQMKKFFGLPPLIGGAFGSCSHPPGPCRIETYQAGLDLAPKPACAG
jgi:hypothetical protein